MSIDLVDGRVADGEQLAAISTKLKMRPDRTFISFFLPGMKLGLEPSQRPIIVPRLRSRLSQYSSGRSMVIFLNDVPQKASWHRSHAATSSRSRPAIVYAVAYALALWCKLVKPAHGTQPTGPGWHTELDEAALAPHPPAVVAPFESAPDLSY